MNGLFPLFILRQLSFFYSLEIEIDKKTVKNKFADVLFLFLLTNLTSQYVMPSHIFIYLFYYNNKKKEVFLDFQIKADNHHYTHAQTRTLNTYTRMNKGI
jgi:hypothetical protein